MTEPSEPTRQSQPAREPEPWASEPVASGPPSSGPGPALGPSRQRATRFRAAGIGVLVSIVTGIVLAVVGLGAVSLYLPTFAGIVVGTLVAGRMSGASGITDWAILAGLIILGQMLVGAVLLFIATR